MKRSELYGPIDFLTNCGGLLGIFMSVSLLSIVELIYYFTLRLGCTLRIQRTEKRAAAAEDDNGTGISIEMPYKEKDPGRICLTKRCPHVS